MNIKQIRLLVGAGMVILMAYLFSHPPQRSIVSINPHSNRQTQCFDSLKKLRTYADSYAVWFRPHFSRDTVWQCVDYYEYPRK